MTVRGSRSRGRGRRLNVIERPVEPEKPKLSSAEAVGFHLANALLAVPEDYKSTPESDRSQAIEVLGSVINLIKAIAPAAAKRIAIPLDQLRFALIELNFGNVVLMLRPRKLKDGRPRDTIARTSLRGLASGVMTVLMDLGLTRKESAEKIAAVLRAKEFQDVSWNTVAQWRDQVLRPGKRHRARDACDLVISMEYAALEELRSRGSPSEAARNRYVKDFLGRFRQLVEEQRILIS
jgi:hypothetical protein